MFEPYLVWTTCQSTMTMMSTLTAIQMTVTSILSKCHWPTLSKDTTLINYEAIQRANHKLFPSWQIQGWHSCKVLFAEITIIYIIPLFTNQNQSGLQSCQKHAIHILIQFTLFLAISEIIKSSQKCMLHLKNISISYCIFKQCLMHNSVHIYSIIFV